MVISQVKDIDPEATDFALFSGGNDSVVSTHHAHKHRDIDYTVYLDTNSSIPENVEHVKHVCAQYGWGLAILQSPVTLEEFAVGTDTRQALGFPGPGVHSWAFQYFKERQLAAIATHTNNEPRFYTGVRSDESSRRMRNVKGEEQEAERWTWISLIHDWSDAKTDQYRENHNLPKNPVAEKIGRSGDCYCGAYANRDIELVELEAEYPRHAEFIKETEEAVQDEIGTDEDYCYWGFGDMSEKELRAKIAQNDDQQMMLCSSCDVPSYDEVNNG